MSNQQSERQQFIDITDQLGGNLCAALAFLIRNALKLDEVPHDQPTH